MDVKVSRPGRSRVLSRGTKGCVDTGSSPPPASSLWKDLALLGAMPLALALLNSEWLWGSPVRDPWIYYGYFKRLPLYLSTFSGAYFSSRLSVLLPGWAVHSVLPPLVAHLVLHLLLVWAALGSFYVCARGLLGRRPALFSAIVLAAHPFFLFALGDNYVDGFGITYAFLALGTTTLAARKVAPVAFLSASGVLSTLLVSANLFYGIFLPFLALNYLVRAGRRSAREHVLAFGWATLGSSGSFLALCLASKALGGRYLYILNSTRFAGSLLHQTNPFRWTLGAWIPIAVWLVFPVLVLAGLPLALRRWRGSLTAPRLWSQGSALGFFVAMLGVQASPVAPVLQWWYYASILIPFTFLAFAGQAESWIGRLPEDRFRRLIVMTAAALLVAHSVQLPYGRLSGALSVPVALPLVAGLGVPLVLLARFRGSRATLLHVSSLALSMLLARNLAFFPRGWELLAQDRKGLFLQLTRAEAAARRYDAGVGLYYWWHGDDPLAVLFDLTAATALSEIRMVNVAFPDTGAGVTAAGAPLGPGMKIAILSRDRAAATVGLVALEQAGFEAAFLGQEPIPGAVRTFHMSVIELRNRRPGAP